MDVTFEKIQSKNACVMGPLSKLWMLVEEARRSKEKQMPIDLDNIRAYIEKTVLLLGQISNYITYFRRYNILVAVNCPAQQSKEMLREEADLLQRHDRNLSSKLSSTTANKSTEINSILSSDCIPQQQFKKGTSVVDPKSPDFQWALPNSASKFFDIKDECIQERQGSSLSGNSNGT